jgi:pyridoxal phosphate enzyme (YggS family)
MMTADYAVRLHAVLGRIRAAEQRFQRPPGSVRLLAVGKTQPAAAIAALAAAGQRDFGENYFQEALDKMTELATLELEWHFIGPMQANKTRGIAEHFAWVHSVDRLKIAERLSAQRPDHLPGTHQTRSGRNGTGRGRPRGRHAAASALTGLDGHSGPGG